MKKTITPIFAAFVFVMTFGTVAQASPQHTHCQMPCHGDMRTEAIAPVADPVDAEKTRARIERIENRILLHDNTLR